MTLKNQSFDWLMRISLAIFVVLSLVSIGTGEQRLDYSITVKKYKHSVCTTSVSR